jgi:hypothetical protein
MLRQIFSNLGSCPDTDPACTAVSPFLSGKRRPVWLLTALLTPLAVCSPVLDFGVNPSTFSAKTYVDSPITGAVRTGMQELQSRAGFPPWSFTSALNAADQPPGSITFLSTISPVSAPNSADGETGVNQEQGYGWSSYLLLTTGLILLAFRPAGSGIAGRV